MMDPFTDFAKELKDRDNIVYDGYYIGRVISDFPDIKIEVNESTVLNKSHLVFSASLLRDYTREFEINEGTSKQVGKIKWTDTIKLNDKVILVPSANGQSYIVIDKAVTFDVSGD